MAGCHYTPGEIDALEMHDVAALLALWREQPPTHEVLAAVYRVTPAPLPDAQDPSGIGALIARRMEGCQTDKAYAFSRLREKVARRSRIG